MECQQGFGSRCSGLEVPSRIRHQRLRSGNHESSRGGRDFCWFVKMRTNRRNMWNWGTVFSILIYVNMYFTYNIYNIYIYNLDVAYRIDSLWYMYGSIYIYICKCIQFPCYQKSWLTTDGSKNSANQLMDTRCGAGGDHQIFEVSAK